MTTDIRVVLSPVHLPHSLKGEEPFLSHAQQCQDDKEYSHRCLDVKDNVFCSPLRNGDQTSVDKTEDVDKSYKDVRTFQPFHTVETDSGSSPLSKKRLEFQLDNSSSEQKFDLALSKVYKEGVKSTVDEMKHLEKLINCNGITGQKIQLELPKACEGLKNTVGKKKHLERPSNCIKHTEGEREENKINRIEIKHKKRTPRESTPKSRENDSKKHASVVIHNGEINEMKKTTPQKCLSKLSLSRSDDSDVDILGFTSPVQLLNTSNKISSPIQSSTTKLGKHSKHAGIKLKSKEASESVMKVIDSVAQGDSMEGVNKKTAEYYSVCKRLEPPTSQPETWAHLTEESFESQSEMQLRTIPHIIVSINCDLIDRVPSIPLKLPIKRTYSPEDSDIKIRTGGVPQSSSNKNDIKKMREVKKERQKAAQRSKESFHCKNGKSRRTDEVKTCKRKATEKTELKEKKKACSNAVISEVLGSKVDRITATELRKVENKVSSSPSTRCDSPSSFSLCSTTSQHGVKNIQETKLAVKKTKGKSLEKGKQKYKEEAYCKTRTLKSEKDSSFISNRKESDERKQDREGKEKERVRLKNKEKQEDGCSESKKPKKDTLVENHFTLSSQDNGYGQVEADRHPSSMNHEQISREKNEPTPNSYSDSENPVHDEVTNNDRCQALDDEDTRCHSPDYYLNEAKKLKHEADKEITLANQAVKYLEAVCNFVLTGNAMEHNHLDSERIYTMYKETLDLLRCVWSKFQKMNHSSSSCSLDKRLTVLSLRCQSLLYYKLYQLRRPEVRELQKTINEYHKTNTGRFSSHQSPLPSSNHTPNPNCHFSQPSPVQPRSCNGTAKDGIASPRSPTPSPAGSVASVGSQSSGYISCEVNCVGAAGSQTRSVSAVATPLSVSSHAGPSRPSGSSLTSVSVPQHLYILLQKQNTHLTNLHMCHELWEQAHYLIVHCNSQDFFAALDSSCDSISLDTPLSDLVRYVQAGLSKLKDAS
ncbi:AF4/FMR2 family member 4-like isoform X1 [Limulus polyphemus]|uniref:AF4/FMR2 family member lilli n=1 Tax=Limulus polyphemus TaxID=6850 RepID=A0ABM1TP88_LIMPO|nr:AF4/FMR2 family member 4-like isoform X1 [Limulus polyphemus]